MVIENTAEISCDDVTGDELWKIKTLGRSCRGCGQPFESGGRGQKLGIQGAEAGSRTAKGAEGFGPAFTVDDFETGNGCGHSLGHGAGALA